MSSKWLILAIVVLIYLPVSIDATVLHVATPTLSESLSLSSNELLWIIDIYSLVMAGLILPMGALGDRIGYKRLMMIGGTLFGLASLAAAYSWTAFALICFTWVTCSWGCNDFTCNFICSTQYFP